MSAPRPAPAPDLAPVPDRAPAGAGWRPLLDGELAERALDAALAVAEALREPFAADPEAATPGLSRGHPGRALLFTYLADGLDRPGWRDPAADALDAAIGSLADDAVGPELYAGFAGVGWTVGHLAGRLFPAAEAVEAAGEIDEALDGLLGRPWEGAYDLIGGLAGFGIYALEGPPRPAARRCLELAVDQLLRRGRRDGDGLSWFTPAWLVPPQQREEAPDGYHNLGLAHGVPGAIVLLARAVERGAGGAEAAAALEAAVGWLLAREQPPASGARFANWIAAGPAATREPELTRLAWCYGDLGIAAALDLAGRAAGRADWAATALRIARLAAERPDRRSGVQDAGLCHGAAGVAHVFNRLAQATGDDLLAAAAHRWCRRTLELRRPGEGVAGFLSWEPSRGGWLPDSGLLTGAAGVALALLAAATPVEPEWDRALALSTAPAQPPGGGRAA